MPATRTVTALLAALVVLTPGVAAAQAPAPTDPAAHAGVLAPVATIVEVRRDGASLDVVRRAAPSPAAARVAAADAGADPDVVAAGVDQPVALVAEGPAAAPAPAPAEPLEQWALDRLAAPALWAGGDAEGEVIAVLDTGVDAAHPDLAPVTRPGTDLLAPGDGRTDPNGHGTHVAGIAAAVGDDGAGVAGLARGAEILPVRMLDERGTGYASDVVEGIIWAVDHGATVISLSLAGPGGQELYDAAVAYAEANGVVVVAAAGNEGTSAPASFPAGHERVLGVGATTPTDQRHTTSSVGPWVAMAAPGASIVSTLPGGGHGEKSGTSMATAYVAASVALLHADEPALGAADLRSRLTGTAVDLGAPGPDTSFGYGLVSPSAARNATTAPGTPAAPAPEPAPTPTTTPGGAPVGDLVNDAPATPLRWLSLLLSRATSWWPSAMSRW